MPIRILGLCPETDRSKGLVIPTEVHSESVQFHHRQRFRKQDLATRLLQRDAVSSSKLWQVKGQCIHAATDCVRCVWKDCSIVPNFRYSASKHILFNQCLSTFVPNFSTNPMRLPLFFTFTRSWTPLSCHRKLWSPMVQSLDIGEDYALHM